MAQTVEDLERQIEQLKARKRALMQKENQRNRKRRNHALMTAGALVESCFDGGWTEIGYGRLGARTLSRRTRRSAFADGRGRSASRIRWTGSRRRSPTGRRATTACEALPVLSGFRGFRTG